MPFPLPILIIPPSLKEATTTLPFSFSGGLTYYVANTQWIVHDGTMYFLQAPLAPPLHAVVRPMKHEEYLYFQYRCGPSAHVLIPTY